MKEAKKISLKLFVFLIVIVCGIVIGNHLEKEEAEKNRMGGNVYTMGFHQEKSTTSANDSLEVGRREMEAELEEEVTKRFFRPSQLTPLENPYTYLKLKDKTSFCFQKPESAVYAFYGVLEEAANITSDFLGCGSIGDGIGPYKVAYCLLSKEKQSRMSYKEFLDSFQGIGHISLLQVHKAYEKNSPANVQYYMVELETIEAKNEAGIFGYYTGIVTVKEQNGYWLIEEMDLLPENWLCAPYHGWRYNATSIIEIASGGTMEVKECKVDSSQGSPYYMYYVTDAGEEYRFDFVRITNGYDLLLHQYQCKEGSFQEKSVFDEKWDGLVFNLNKIRDGGK